MSLAAELPSLETQSKDLLGITRRELTAMVSLWGFSAAHAARLWRYLYRDRIDTPAELTDLPAGLRSKLNQAAALDLPRQICAAQSTDGLTRKYLLELRDGAQIETVLMRFKDRVTACLSSQVGCAMGCIFCATGQMGFGRPLSAGEMVAQVLHMQRALWQANSCERLQNVVLMGMGEPLHNYDAVLKAVEILCDREGLALGPRHITLSTVGVVPGIVRLADEGRTIRLAVSLHAATQEERAALIPVARAWPLDALLKACRYYAHKLDRRIFFEWALIGGKNDSPETAHALARLLGDLPSHVNLIPLNPTADYAAGPSPDEVALRFQAVLAEHHIPSTIRQRRGIDIAAGCGQLAGNSARSSPLG